MLKINLGNSSCQFSGFVNSAEFFAQQGQGTPDQSQTVLNGAELNTMPWPIADNSVSSAKLIYSLEMPHDNKSVLDLMIELYRVCADGALVEIRVHSPLYLRALDFPYQFNVITDRTLRFFDRDIRESMQQDPALQFLIPTKSDGSPLDVNFKLLKHELALSPQFTARVQGKEFKDNNEFNQALNSDPNAIRFQTFFLAAQKDSNHHFALANTANLPSFAVRIQDPQLNRYGTLALIKTGAWNAKMDNTFVQILSRMAQHKSEYQQELHFTSVGSNIGWYPLLATLAADNVRVECFEPDPNCVEILKHNMELNDVAGRVNVSAVALSDKTGQSALYVNKQANGADSLVKESDSDEQIQVECNTLDNIYLNQDSANWPSLLMMDTLGHEHHVFAGARGMFERGYRPVIISEFNPKLLDLNGECTFHHELVEKYEYTPYIINTSNQDNSTLFRTDIEFLDKAFEEIRKDKNTNIQLNLVFVPSWMNPETFRPNEN